MAFKNNLLFEYLKNILQIKSGELFARHIESPDFKSSFSSYMILRYLSMSKYENVRTYILENQKMLEKIPQENLYKILLETLPKLSNSYIQYLKG